MTVYFCNSGALDLDTVRLMGVSVKKHGNPIGFFGTGLKYAIATLLRTHHSVSMDIRGENYVFEARPKEIRGEKFDVVFMNDEQLGFTTDLGKNWQVWQAYRELHSNCLDEKGKITNKPMMAETVITVEGPEIDDIYYDRGSIFLHGEPWLFQEGLEIYRGQSRYVYYRGVRVHELAKPSIFTYNLTMPMQLTEDRTIQSVYDMNYRIECRLPRFTDPELIEKLVLNKKDTYDNALDFAQCSEPSEVFLDIVEKHHEDTTMNPRFRELLGRNRKSAQKFKEFMLTEVEEKTVAKARYLLTKIDPEAGSCQFHYVENLGPSVYAVVLDEKMYITRQTIANGESFLAITMYEEFLHVTKRLDDESRAMQQYLFDKILQLVKEL